MITKSKNGNLKVDKFLVENGVDVTAYDNQALGLASMNGHLDVVKYLVENGAPEPETFSDYLKCYILSKIGKFSHLWSNL